ncbi:uncharacterized protein [Dysidea avara]|uniref:uncharacterized protein n=1 Tax=Dysidea avara TaxID=196820 RepID=UPI0033273105
MAATGITKEVAEKVAKDRQQLDEDKKKFDEEKKRWEEEKAKINGQKVILDVGGTCYSTSRSTLTKYPESRLGVMFSGRHDLDTMKSSDGSFFIDRDGARFRYILDYLRDGKEVMESFPKSHEALLGLLREAKYFQLQGLVSAFGPLLREVDVIFQNDIAVHFISQLGVVTCEYSLSIVFQTTQRSTRAISYKHKNMRGLSFNAIKFDYPVSFIGCDLSVASFTCCCFESDVTFQNCILDDTVFFQVNGLASFNRFSHVTHNVTFTGSKTDKTNFDANLRKALISAGNIK